MDGRTHSIFYRGIKTQLTDSRARNILYRSIKTQLMNNIAYRGIKTELMSDIAYRGIETQLMSDRTHSITYRGIDVDVGIKTCIPPYIILARSLHDVLS